MKNPKKRTNVIKFAKIEQQDAHMTYWRINKSDDYRYLINAIALMDNVSVPFPHLLENMK